jgi:hypothetical protein
VRFAAPSVVCPRCGNESPPSGAGRFMTCAKCGMSIDSGAAERQEAVRGRVKEKPEIEIDPTLPPTPSRFPLGVAIAIAFLVAAGVVIVAYEVRQRRTTVAQQRNLDLLHELAAGVRKVWDTKPRAQQSPACVRVFELTQETCLPSVVTEKLAFPDAIAAITSEDPEDCVQAVEIFARSRFDAKCD